MAKRVDDDSDDDRSRKPKPRTASSPPVPFGTSTNSVKSWSISPIVRSVQELWVRSGVPISYFIKELEIPRSRAYALLVHGTPNPKVHYLDAVTSCLGKRPQWIDL